MTYRKNFFRHVLFIVTLMVVCACSKENDSNEFGYLYFNNTTIQMSSDGGHVNRSIESNVDWSVSVDKNYDWLQFSSINGVGNGTISFFVAPNSSTTQRTAYIKISSSCSDIATSTLCIIQSGSNGNIGGNDNDGDENTSSLVAPTGVSAKVNGSSISISWNAVTGATKYNVYRNSSSTGSFSYITTTSGTTATDNNPLSGFNYYKVTAANGSKESDYSSMVYASFFAKPATPTGLRAIQSGNAINVSWNAVQNAYYYRLWYSTPAGIQDFTNVYAPSTSAVFNQNMKDGTYTFWVQALNSNYDESASSAKISCTFKSGSGGSGGDGQSKLDTPQNLEAYSGGSYVQISFDEVSLAYQYELYRSTSATYGYTKIPASGGSISGKRYILTDSNPKSGTTYYKVKAVALSYLNIADSDLSSYIKVVN
ncbi:MAG: hypothetical protein NC388_05150 [Clostridium sp.]|nr:hypothetical protein [Clostridium sp.]